MGWMGKALRDQLGISRGRTRDDVSGLAAAAEWLVRAQDATSDDGVSAYYDLKKSAWAGSYPETTGYIIPTLYCYADFVGEADYTARATRMAAWEADIQLTEGGVRAGTLDADRIVPTIFNTGQVLFGWAAAFERTRENRFLDALRLAADWLVAAQDEDGAWRRFASPFSGHTVNTYNTRVAFGLARASQVTACARHMDAARANVAWALTQLQDNGWPANNDLEHNDQPLTHTLAYAIRGILEVGIMAEDTQLIEVAARMARAVMQTQRADGALPGRLDAKWLAACRWSCVTGNAQMAIIWQRLAQVVGEKAWIEPARRANRFNLSVQDVAAIDPGARGGIQGSYPIGGGYMTYRYPNWAAKFFMDAILLEQGASVDG